MKEINKEIEKTFTGMESLMGILYDLFRDIVKIFEEKKDLEPVEIINEIKKLLASEDGSHIREDIKIKLNHLFNSSQPAPSEEERLHYSFFELQDILTRVVNGLPGLVNEKGEMNERLLNLLTNFLVAVERLEKGQEERVTIPVDENSSYWLVSSSEKERLENELKREKLRNSKLIERIISLEAAEKDREKQLKQREKKEQQTRNEIKKELASIENSASSLGGLSTEELSKFLTRLREMKNSLNNGANTKEQILKKNIDVKDDEREELKKILGQLKLEEQRRDTEQAIACALADEEAVKLGKQQIVIESQELPDWKKWEGAEEQSQKFSKGKYRNYPTTLDEMNDLVEIINFEREILQVIAKQKQKHRIIIDTLFQGEKAIENQEVNKAIEVKEFLINFRKLHYKIFLKNSGKSNALIAEIRNFISNKQKEVTARVEQPAK